MITPVAEIKLDTWCNGGGYALAQYVLTQDGKNIWNSEVICSVDLKFVDHAREVLAKQLEALTEQLAPLMITPLLNVAYGEGTENDNPSS